MPYIKEEQRARLEPTLGVLIDDINRFFINSEQDGVLNYVISRLVTETMGAEYDPSVTDWSYREIARAVAVFECAKLEFYRRIAAPKEDKAISQNGDIPAYDKDNS